MSKIYFLLFACLFCSACAATNDFKEVKLISVYDGDTFKVNLSCKKAVFCKEISVRVRGIDTAELKTKNLKEKQKALAAKEFTEQFLFSGKIILRNCQRDKYFRLLCEVFVENKKETINLAQELLSSDLAIKYESKKKS